MYIQIIQICSPWYKNTAAPGATFIFPISHSHKQTNNEQTRDRSHNLVVEGKVPVRQRHSLDGDTRRRRRGGLECGHGTGARQVAGSLLQQPDSQGHLLGHVTRRSRVRLLTADQSVERLGADAADRRLERLLDALRYLAHQHLHGMKHSGERSARDLLPRADHGFCARTLTVAYLWRNKLINSIADQEPA